MPKRTANLVPAVSAVMLIYAVLLPADAVLHHFFPEVLIIYEHFALLGQEVDYMWHWRTSNVTVLFLVNRYILLLSAALGISSVFDWDTSRVSHQPSWKLRRAS